MGDYWKPATEADRDLLRGQSRIKASTGKTRTSLQNKCLHKWLGELADALNNAGLHMMLVLRHDAEIPWDMDLAKKFLWRPIQKVMTGHESTRDPTPKDYIAIQETLIAHLAKTQGVSVEWPSVDRMDRDSQGRESRLREDAA
jgi:hypothetical protein